MKKLYATFLFLFPISFNLSAADSESPQPTLSPPVKLSGIELKDLEGPEFADVDGDGRADLLSGTYSGNLLFRKNTGETKPKFSDPAPLQSEGKDIKLKHW